MSLAIVGNSVVDIVFPGLARMPSWPSHLEFTPDNLVFPRRPPIVTLGGNGANAAFVAARCGADVELHTPLGRDDFGNLVRRWLCKAGCRVAATRSPATAVNTTATNRRDQRATLFYPGAQVRMPRPPQGLSSRRRKGAAGLPSHLLVCGWPHPSLASIAKSFAHCGRRKIFTAIDAGPILGKPWTLGALSPVLRSLDLFLANDYEIRAITRQAGLVSALVALRRRYRGHIVIKRGSKGALWLPADSDRLVSFAPKRIRVVNTVGAGDTFNGALLAQLSKGVDWTEALLAANATAATVIASQSGVLGARLRLR